MEGVAGGLKQEGWDMGKLKKGLGSWGGWSLEGWDGHLFRRSDGRIDGKKEIPLLFFRSSAQEEIP